MELRELLGRIGTTYDRSLGQRGEAQRLLRQTAPAVLLDLLPANLLPVGSGGKGNAAVVPWIAVFDPIETETAQRGIYVVYLFDATMTTVSLSLNQGVTELVDRLGTTEGRRTLARQAETLRQNLSIKPVSDLLATIDLRSARSLPRNYEAGNILARTYDLASLPSNSELVGDLHRFVDLYSFALELKTSLRLSTPDAIATTQLAPQPRLDAAFKPKDESDYLQHLPERTLRKRRDHERVIRQYVDFLTGRGYAVNNQVHPRDLTAAKAGDEWLMEVKVVYRGDGVSATRDALSQLLMYRDSLYRTGIPVRLAAIFSDSVGEYCVGFLERHKIASVWKDGPRWVGSPTAYALGIADAAVDRASSPPWRRP